MGRKEVSKNEFDPSRDRIFAHSLFATHLQSLRDLDHDGNVLYMNV